MKKVLIVFSVAFIAAVSVLNVNLFTNENSTKTAGIVSLNKAFATPENPAQLGCIFSYSLPCGDEKHHSLKREIRCDCSWQNEDKGCTEEDC